MSAAARAKESRRLLRESLCEMVAQGSWWRKSPGEESLHDFRISLRRCRGLLRILKDEFPERKILPLRLALSRAAGSLGEVRDLDIMLELVAQIGRHHKPPGKMDALVTSLQKRRLASYQRAVTLFSGPAWVRIQKRIDNLLLSTAKGRSQANDQTMKKLADHEYRRLVRSVVRAQELAETTDAESLHNFRTKLRRLRYFGRLMAGYIPSRRRRKITRIRACEQQLGRVHDVDVTLDWITRHPRSSPVWLPGQLRVVRKHRLDVFQKEWGKNSRKLGI